MRLFKKVLSCVLILVFACYVPVPAGAYEQHYDTAYFSGAQWNGTGLSVHANSGALYLSEAGQTFTEIMTGEANALLIYFDAGSYSGKGGGEVLAECLDENGEAIKSYGSAAIPDDGAFRRYNIGTGELYAGLPENTRVLRLTFSGASQGPYFKTLDVTLSNTAARDMTVNSWSVSDKTGNVDVNVTRTGYVSMVVLIFGVALVMLGVRKYLDRLKKKG